ncbi:hypothetical protein [Rhizobium ruizarguesonis]|uniref:hypothetical protein n=1 Tax=Rhizobium ruizarguesonis TaxID=2081791 RepID=UPI00102F4135|nr:hypothetical protein [Rhizobium ruizarguesonis]TAZ68238.1 hypothetical protein ELH68_32630 [Rhizobium ruizarguesonis]TAZ92268.1 hypothetical protein ELH64_25700 [Rhizobium ruizarguesonis]
MGGQNSRSVPEKNHAAITMICFYPNHADNSVCRRLGGQFTWTIESLLKIISQSSTAFAAENGDSSLVYLIDMTLLRNSDTNTSESIDVIVPMTPQSALEAFVGS